MRKKYLVLLGAVLIGLAFHACSMPDKINKPKTIKVKGNLDYDLLLNAANIDLSKMFIDMIREQLTDISEYFTLDVWEVDYGNKQKEQAFLLKLSTTLTNSLNPGTYLNGAGFKIDDALSSDPFDIDYSIEMDPIEIKKTVGKDLSFLGEPGDVVTITAGSPSIEIPETTFDENDTGFLHAVIEEVDFKIEFVDDPGGLTENDLEFTFTASQDPDGFYSGLTGSSLSPGDLEGKTINRKALSFSEGNIKIKPGTTLKIPGTQTMNLTVTMNIKKLKDVKWDFAKVSEQFQEEEEFPPYSLAEPAKYVKELDFDRCNDTGEQGIGLIARFEKIIPGLALTVSCDDIGVYNVTNALVEKEDIVFGNKNGKEEFQLEKYKEDAEYLEYELALKPASDTDVLEIPELTLGEPLELIGTVKFFHHWTKAILYTQEIIKFANISEDDFRGDIPDVNNDEEAEAPIDLSMMTKYFEGGFTIDGIKAEIYLSGPKKTLPHEPEIEFSAKLFMEDLPPVSLGESLYIGPLRMGPPPSLPPLNEHYRSRTLPQTAENGMNINGTAFESLLETIISKPPDNLYFQYRLDLEETLTITPDMFDDDDEAEEITADVLVLLPLKLKAGDDGLRFLFDEYIGDQSDIFGREKPGEKTDFSNMNISTLHVSLEFPEQIFSGGRIFLFTDRVAEVKEETEEETEEVIVKERGVDPLFPHGIPLGGKNSKSIKINVSDGRLTKILGSTKDSRLLVLDPFVEFDKGNTITIPRNAGLIRIKVGFSGDYTINTDDLGLW
jgi:hypothetical protein